MKLQSIAPLSLLAFASLLATNVLATTATPTQSIAKPAPSASAANTRVNKAQIRRAPAVVKQSIPAPYSVVAQSDPDASGVQWQWMAHDCFPAGAGQPVTPCGFVKDIEGFKVYSKEGALVRTVSDPAARATSFKSAGATCFAVTAYKGALESPKSDVACF